MCIYDSIKNIYFNIKLKDNNLCETVCRNNFKKILNLHILKNSFKVLFKIL